MSTAVISPQPIKFTQFENVAADDCAERILDAREQLGERCVLLAHHYQRADVYCHSDLRGDSLELAKLAGQQDAEFIVFCGVHFMAEVADILTDDDQVVVLPDLAAGCTMADMASVPKINQCWEELQWLDPEATITPVTYINSSADLKAFCGNHGGITCTSSNAGAILQWAFNQREKVLFFPDQHLGRWTGLQQGIPKEQMAVWDYNQPHGGLTEQQVRDAKILLWKGHCSVHQMFQPSHVHKWREANPDGIVLAHPECDISVCELADSVGSTGHIVKTLAAAKPGSSYLVGTELNLVQRLAEEGKARGVSVKFMSPLVCMCSTMARIDPPHLAWALESLANDEIVNQIKVPPATAQAAKRAITRMFACS